MNSDSALARSGRGPRPAALLASVMLAVSACTSAPPRGGYYQDDGPHARPRVDVSRVPDAVPRAEPVGARGNRPYTVFGRTYHPMRDASGYSERGIASWYGKKFHGRDTSSGEPYDMYAMTAAHKTLPLPSYVQVRNLGNGRTVVVRVNDRGPFKHDRLIDLSYAAAARLDIVGTGTGVVEVTAIPTGVPPPMQLAQSPANGPPKLFVQVGAYTSRANAESMRERLQRADFAPVHIQHADQDRVPLYRVRVGPLASVDASDALTERLRAYGLPEPLVVVE
jgi:rare lipoprotein A